MNFAYNGDPNGYLLNPDGSSSGEILPVWDKREAGQDQLLELGAQIKMTDDPNLAIYKVIDEFMKSRESN